MKIKNLNDITEFLKNMQEEKFERASCNIEEIMDVMEKEEILNSIIEMKDFIGTIYRGFSKLHIIASVLEDNETNKIKHILCAYVFIKVFVGEMEANIERIKALPDLKMEGV